MNNDERYEQEFDKIRKVNARLLEKLDTFKKVGYQLKAGQFVGWAMPTINRRSL